MTDRDRPVTVPGLIAMKARGEKIAALTAYDAAFSAAMDGAGIDLILVGDSLGMTVQGHSTTLPVTLENMVYHAACVSRGLRRALMMVDLPCLSYMTPMQALDSAARLVRESGAHMVKLEGGRSRAEVVRELSRQDIPVCAHLGLLPQSVNWLGGYGVQARDESSASRLMEDALILQDAGATALVLECIPARLASEVTAALTIPVIGIGAGGGCDGQVLVSYDMLGLGRHCPRFCKNFLQSAEDVQGAFATYVAAVKSGEFPAPEHTF